MLRRLTLVLDVLPRLGVVAVLRLLIYRVLVASGYFARKYPITEFSILHDRILEPGDSIKTLPQSPIQVKKAQAIVDGEVQLYGHFACSFDGRPDWHYNAVLKKHFYDSTHWSKITLPAGVKHIWELSRFDWAPTLACAYCESGDEQYLDSLNGLLRDWLDHNPLNQGLNWHCGQETALRLVNLLMAWYLLGKGSQALAAVVEAHAVRISQTRGYGLAQNNNHGTSEAVGLFIGGAWLDHYGVTSESREIGARLASLGRSQLEERVSSLVFSDGGFSQYSTNYHRLLLDTLSLAEFWRRELEQSRFSTRFYDGARNASDWLAALIEPLTGAVPILGGNDGTHLLGWAGVAYEDYRPSVHLASSLFKEVGAYRDDTSIRLGQYLITKTYPLTEALRNSRVFDDSGLVMLVQGKITVILRLPGCRFRPPHADFFHVDVFFEGKNILTDSGSYDYDSELNNYFSGTSAHNTVTFDDQDQMPRLGKFLFAKWPSLIFGSLIANTEDHVSWSGQCRDYKGAMHARELQLKKGILTVTDLVSGNFRNATVRWHLHDAVWQESAEGISCDDAKIEIRNADFELGTSLCSPAYLIKKNRTMISATFQDKVKTIVRFSP